MTISGRIRSARGASAGGVFGHQQGRRFARNRGGCDHYVTLRNDIGKFNEAWITPRRALPGPEVIAEFDTVTSSRLETLRAMSTEDFDKDLEMTDLVKLAQLPPPPPKGKAVEKVIDLDEL